MPAAPAVTPVLLAPGLAPGPAPAPAAVVGDHELVIERPTDDTTTRLLEAAVVVFAEKGYDKAGVAEIARRAGLTTGAIYSRFSGKAELLAAAITGTVPEELDLLFAEHAFNGGVTDILRLAGSHLVTRDGNDRSGLLLEAFVAARRDPEVATALRTSFEARRQRLFDLVEEGQQQGLIDPLLDKVAIVHFAQAVGLGFLGYDAIGLTHPDPDAWDRLIETVVASVFPHDDPDPTAR